jgi:hypothetical protein
MVTSTEHYQLDSNLTLCARSGFRLTFCAVVITLSKHNNELIECRLTFQVSSELYQRIDTEALFNLKPQVRGSLSAGEFLPELNFQLEAMLKPNLLAHLTGHTTTVEEAASYILNLNQEQPDDPLLFTENWLALSVTQPTKSGEIGYRTFWSYISPSAIAQAGSSSEEISETIVNFFHDWTQSNTSANAQKATFERLEEMVNFLKELADFGNALEQNIPSTLTQKVESGWEPTPTGGRIFQAIVNFFKEDDWPFHQIEGESILQIAFQGENGKWTCYAKAREEQEQFVFYSVCSVNVPENKRLAVAEFITRANSGMIIGNFELDFADGEIRYKTSIDVDGDTLTSALIKRLVYANVTMMDEYLPGIMSVIYGEVEPKDAIAQVEG